MLPLPLVGRMVLCAVAVVSLLALIGGPARPAGNDAFAWSQVISPQTIDAEVRAQQARLGKVVQSRSKFLDGGFKEARAEFAVIATLFAIIGEYDGEHRWKSQAANLRDRCGHACRNCCVGTYASFDESKARNDDLLLLFLAVEIEPPGKAAAETKWEKVTDRPPLMKRLEQAYEHRLARLTADRAIFLESKATILHEAQMIAAIAEVIQREGFEFADDATYLGYAAQMRNAASEVAEGARLNNFQRAHQAAGNLHKACANCHEGFRS